MTAEDYSKDYRYILSISRTSVDMIMPLGETCDSLYVNGLHLLWPEWTNQTDDRITYHFEGGALFSDNTGKSDYLFTKNGKTYSGSILDPQAPSINIAQLDLNNDYSFSWTASPKPKHYLLNINFLDDTPDIFVQLSGNKRSYNVDKTPWIGQEYYLFNLWMSSINYRLHGKDLIVMKGSGNVGHWVKSFTDDEGLSR